MIVKLLGKLTSTTPADKNAPSPISQAQLDELSINVCLKKD